jgi:hypothetical protein
MGLYVIDPSDIVNINAPCQHNPLSPSFIGLMNYGVINVNSNFNLVTGVFGIENYGTLNIISSGTVEMSSSVINYGIINNNGNMQSVVLTNNAGAVFNNNAIANEVNITNQVNGIINNNVGGTFSEGNVSNYSQFNNYGTINYTALYMSQFSNESTGIFTNSGAVNNEATIINLGTIDNSATINNTGVLRNNGTISGFNGTVNGVITTTSTSNLNPELIGGAGAFITINNPSTLQIFNNTIINLSIHSTLNYNNISLTGNASLNGATINITLDPAYVPANGHVFNFIHANSFTTSSPTLNLPTIPGYTWSTTFLSGNLVSTLNASIVLPITLKQFTVKELSFGNQLNWEVENESNFSHFEIEKSNGGKDFQQIGRVNLQNISAYSFIDKTLNTKESYYRLKMVDIDGKYAYSNIVSVLNEMSNEIIIPINPTQEGSPVKIISNSNYIVFDIEGKRVDNIQTLKKGIYFVKNIEGKTAKFVIQ